MKSCHRRRQSSKTERVRLFAAGAALAALATVSSARAEDSAYCRKVRERASSDASLMIAPTLRAEAMKLPSSLQPGGRVEVAPGGSSYQVRAGASISLVNVYKGTRLGHVADADCALHQATTKAQELLALAADFGRLNALREQVSFLDKQRPVWEAVYAKMEDRFAAQNVTLLNLEDVRVRTTVLSRHRAQIAGEVARLEAAGLSDQRPDVSALVQNLDAAAMKYEREASHVRSLEAVDLTLTGGYVPPIFDAKNSDFFGVVQISYSLGGPFRNAAETRYLDARAEELKTARYESQAQLHTFRKQVQAGLSEAKQELDVVEKRHSVLQATRATFDGAEAPGAAYALAMVDLELLALRADRIFLAGYVRELSRVEEK